MDINQSNEIIARFMGYDNKVDSYFPQELYKFHKSWEALWLVVEKINALPEVQEFVVTPLRSRIWFNTRDTFIYQNKEYGDTAILMCYSVVIQFLEKYRPFLTKPFPGTNYIEK